MSENSLARKINDRASSVPTWTKPDEFDLSSHADRRELERRLDAGMIDHTVDRLDEYADSMFELQHPELSNDVAARKDFVEDVKSQGENFGRWFQFGWSGALVRFPEREQYQDLRTYRNKDLVTDDEQRKLLESKVAVFGLSVGSNVVDQLVQAGIGGQMMMGDFDTLDPTNLNRIRANATQLGMRKIDIAAIKTSELDPYIEQVHFREGLTEEVFAQLETDRPDVIFDEIDNIAMKAMIRRFAAEKRIPVIMATDVGDTSIIDVERYDLDEKTKPFHGKLSRSDIEELASISEADIEAMSDEDRKRLMAKRQKQMIGIVGARHITPRLLQSAMKIGTELGGLPQLGSTAAEGGALASVAARELLLGRRLKTGRYVNSTRRILELQHVTPPKEGLDTIASFIRASKSQNK